MGLSDPTEFAKKMSRPQGLHPSLFQFENTLRMMLPKGSYMSPRLLALLNSFDEKLALSLKKLMATAEDNILSFSWMTRAMESLCETHNDIKALIVDLELPVADWDEEWTDVYLNNSMKLLDLCNAFSFEISQLSQGRLILQYALRNLDSSSAQLASVHHSLSKWKPHANMKNHHRRERCTIILESIVASLNQLPRVKNSAKGKVLMQAMYGINVKTLFVSSIFTAAFSHSPTKLVELHVPETLPWAETFTRLQSQVTGEIRLHFSNMGPTAAGLKELKVVDASVLNFFRISQAEENNILVQPEALECNISDLRTAAEKFSQELDLLSTQIDSFFQIVLAGRDTMLSSLRSKITIPKFPKKKRAAQTVK